MQRHSSTQLTQSSFEQGQRVDVIESCSRPSTSSADYGSGTLDRMLSDAHAVVRREDCDYQLR